MTGIRLNSHGHVDEPLLRLIGKQLIFVIFELNSSAMVWSIDVIHFAICSIYSLL